MSNIGVADKVLLGLKSGVEGNFSDKKSKSNVFERKTDFVMNDCVDGDWEGIDPSYWIANVESGEQTNRNPQSLNDYYHRAQLWMKTRVNNVNESNKKREMKRGGWTTEEDAQIMNHVIKFGECKWSVVASRLPGRYAKQCNNRYKKLEDKKGESKCTKKSVWTANDDKMILNHGNEYCIDEVDWCCIISRLSTEHTVKQCVKRYMWLSEREGKQGMKRGGWTKEEDEMILEFGKSRGNSDWSIIASKLPGRISKQCNNRFKKLIRTKCINIEKEKAVENRSRLLTKSSFQKLMAKIRKDVSEDVEENSCCTATTISTNDFNFCVSNSSSELNQLSSIESCKVSLEISLVQYYCDKLKEKLKCIFSKQDLKELIFGSETLKEDLEEVGLFSADELLEELLILLLNWKYFTPIGSKMYFVPNLLEENYNLRDVWTYKCHDSWKVTVCHSWNFSNPNVEKVGVFKFVLCQILRDLFSFDKRKCCVRHISCWKTALFLVLSSSHSKEDSCESFVDIFLHWTAVDDDFSVGSERRCMHRKVPKFKLTLSGKGQSGFYAKIIYEGGYNFVMNSVDSALKTLKENDSSVKPFTKEAICPDCLALLSIKKACSWEYDSILKNEVKNKECRIICEEGHATNVQMLTGPKKYSISPSISCGILGVHQDTMKNKVEVLSRAVVLVGLWDEKKKQIISVGSGFIVDNKRAFIITASHTLISPLGEEYYGCKYAKAVIGIIPFLTSKKTNVCNKEAVFRYFAQIVAKDVKNVDACILRITSKLEQDVKIEKLGEGCAGIAEIPLLNHNIHKEGLDQLNISYEFELQEQVRIIGYNQDSEGLLTVPGTFCNGYIDFSFGYICKHFIMNPKNLMPNFLSLDNFRPREEIVVMCPTISGHSGGPCVNYQGEVIGLLSRVDSAEMHRCYVVPASEWKHLLKKANSYSTSGIPIEIHNS